MQPSQYFSIAIKSLLITVAIVLALNFACARGAGVQVLNFLGQVPIENIEQREFIMQGVAFMQLVIKILAGVGLLICGYFFYRGIKTSQRN